MVKRLPFSLGIVALSAIPIALNGCGGGVGPTMPAGVSAKASRELNAGYQKIYDFKGGHHDGSGPNGALAAMNGVLYGTTDSGGYGYHGNGTVYSITTSGEERVIYRFKDKDGIYPNGDLIALHGVLYGTTVAGGIDCDGESEFTGCGTVFSVTPSGQEHVLYRFKGGSDGIAPFGGLVWFDGKFYGTTSRGGLSTECPQLGYGTGCGTVFSVDTSGNERVLYRFTGFSDGAYPLDSLLLSHGNLYGTTNFGGAGGACDYYCGTLFEITTAGTEKILYRFEGYSDGSNPNGSLIRLNGAFYGTTTSGGEPCGCGTVFKTSPSGSESVLYAFKSLPDAQGPYGRLVADGQRLYGAASGGEACFYHYSGTLFSVTTAGNERVEHTFSCSGASDPAPGLLQLGRSLYGATFEGGRRKNGTVFAFTP